VQKCLRASSVHKRTLYTCTVRNICYIVNTLHSGRFTCIMVWFRNVTVVQRHSSLVIGTGVNGKDVCDFVLVNKSNVGRIVNRLCGSSARKRPIALSPYAITIDCVYDSKAWRYAEDDRTECTSKSEAEVTNNKKTALEVLYYWRNEASYWHTRSIARPVCDSRASCYIPCT